MIKTPASIVLIVYTFISMWFVGGLTAFHLYLISTNQVKDPSNRPNPLVCLQYFFMMCDMIIYLFADNV